MSNAPADIEQSSLAVYSATKVASSKSYLHLLLVILTILAFVRLAGLHLSVVDLLYDESQYWFWSQHPALGYYSKPPLLAWLLYGWTHFCGNDEWCVRSPAPLIYTATCFFIYLIGRKLYDEQTGFWAAILMAFAPGVVFSARIFSTDVPLLFFWSVALHAFLGFVETRRVRSAAIMGFAVGLGLLSKYAMIYFIPGLVLASLVSPRHRQAVKAPAMLFALLVAVMTVLPNLIWNFANSFTTFRHTGGLVLGKPFQPSLQRVLGFLLSQLGIMGPILFPVVLWETVRSRFLIQSEADRLMIAFFITPIAVVSLFAIYSTAYPNWAAPSIVAAVLAGAAFLLRKGGIAFLHVSLAIGLAVQLILLVGDSIATRLPPRLGHFNNPYARSIGLRQLAANVENAAFETGARTIATDDRRTFATLNYYLRGSPRTIVSWSTSDKLPFDFGYEIKPGASEPILFVTVCPDADRLRPFYSQVLYLGIRPAQAVPAFRFQAFRLSDYIATDRPLLACNNR